MVRNGTGETRTDPATSGILNSLPAAHENRELLEDPLAYLPCSTIVEYSRGQLIYGRSQTSNNIYLVIDGKVKVCRTADDGRQVVVDIYQPDEFFGECGFLGEKHRLEEAVALDATKVMTWSTAEIEELVVRRPRLGIALVQLLVRRSMDFGARIESFSIDNIGRRLVRSLVRFSERLGKDTGDGSVEMMPFTHELLSQYVGTSREIVTHYMNQLRRQGYLRYSRKGITLNRESLRDWLQRDASAHSE